MGIDGLEIKKDNHFAFIVGEEDCFLPHQIEKLVKEEDEKICNLLACIFNTTPEKVMSDASSHPEIILRLLEENRLKLIRGVYFNLRPSDIIVSEMLISKIILRRI